MKPSFSTPRLEVRDLAGLAEGSDARAALDAALPAILTEPVLRHLPPDLQHSGQGFDAQVWLGVLTSRNAVGVVTRVADNMPIGFLALRAEAPPDRTPILWIGYLFAESAWGQGYATELVRGVVAARSADAEAVLQAGVATGNAGSARVLLKAGFAESTEGSGADWKIFRHP